MLRISIVVVLGLTSAVGCPAGSDDEADAKSRTPAGALACEKTPVECREAFADNYEGAYASTKTGRVILDIDALGEIVGSVIKGDGTSVAAFGKVDEFGQINFTDDDGTQWKGQFSAQHTISGTWTGTDDSTGTFVAVSSTLPVQSAPTTTSPSSSTPPPSNASASEAVAAAVSACEATKDCEGATADCAEIEAAGEGATLPQECRAQELALYECMTENGCDAPVDCDALAEAAITCAFGGP